MIIIIEIIKIKNSNNRHYNSVQFISSLIRHKRKNGGHAEHNNLTTPGK